MFKEIESGVRTNVNEYIYGGSWKETRYGREIVKSLNQCSKDGHYTGQESHLSTVVKSCFGLSKFSNC
jgi:hypothetical protein